MNPLMGRRGIGLQMGAQQVKFQGFWYNYVSVTFFVFSTATGIFHNESILSIPYLINVHTQTHFSLNSVAILPTKHN